MVYPYADSLTPARPTARPSGQQRSFEEALRLGLPSYAAPSARRTFGLDPAPKRPDLRDLGSTGPGVDTGRDDTGGDIVSRTTPTPYPAVLPPLSPEMLAAIDARRRAANRALAEAEARTESQRTSAELEAAGRLLGIEDETARQRRAGVSELAARGVARSPMFANPFRRELARVQQQQIGESQQKLASTLDQLQAALEAARQRREEQLAQIAFDEMAARSNVNRLLGV